MVVFLYAIPSIKLSLMCKRFYKIYFFKEFFKKNLKNMRKKQEIYKKKDLFC